MGLNMKIEETYYDPESVGSLGGVNALARTAKSRDKEVKEWLSGEDVYTLHKPVRYRFPRRGVVTGGIDIQWQADLVDVQKIQKHNDGFKYLLTCMDVFSKYAWVVMLGDKTGRSLVSAFSTIMEEGRQPQSLQTDKGTEFTNRLFQQFLKKNGIDFFTTHNEETKASIVERFNRTLKTRIWRYFTKSKSLRYVDVLGSMVSSYNSSYHSSIRMAPEQVTQDQSKRVWDNLYPSKVNPRPKHTFQIGDSVRLSKARRVFKKGYLPNWTEELFTVSGVLRTRPETYHVKDDSGEVLKGTFYRWELQKVKRPEFYEIESVEDRRKRKGKVQFLVKWKGYPESFNSWVDESDMKKL